MKPNKNQTTWFCLTSLLSLLDTLMFMVVCYASQAYLI